MNNISLALTAIRSANFNFLPTILGYIFWWPPEDYWRIVALFRSKAWVIVGSGVWGFWVMQLSGRFVWFQFRLWIWRPWWLWPGNQSRVASTNFARRIAPIWKSCAACHRVSGTLLNVWCDVELWRMRIQLDCWCGCFASVGPVLGQCWAGKSKKAMSWSRFFCRHSATLGYLGS